MSEMTSVEQQQQQFVGGSSSSEHHCKDHRVSFESEKSLEVHLRYHQENLLSEWGSQAQQEESNNNNSKAGNHNSSNHMGVKRESVTAPADSSEPSSRPPSGGTAASSSQQQPTPTSQEFSNFTTPMFNENFFMQNEANYIVPHNDYSPNREDSQNGGGNFSRYHPYQHQQLFQQGDPANSVSSSSPRSPLQCDKCGVVYEDPNLLAEHVRSSHPTSPNAYQSQAQPQYQQLGTSPQHQIQRHQQSQMHTSPPLTGQQQQQGFDFSGGSIHKTDKHDAEDQAEILDLDSHKVQTHRYEEDMIRAQQQQEIHMQLQHHALHHQRASGHSVSSMLSWSSPQLHEYHSGISPMGQMESTSPMPDQGQFLRGQQMPLEPVRHGNTPVITNSQTIVNHQLPPALLQQSQKPPLANQSWKSNEARRPKTYNCTACNKWFTSSGHLKRHYNTTLHKNAVKVSNKPDPANMPISVHHHPVRDAVNTRGGPRSPELSSSGSPPNLMAGPSGEATRGLQHTPTIVTSNSNSSNSNSSESSGIQGILSQQQQQQMSSAVHMSNLGSLNCPPQSPMGHLQQPMGAPSPQLGQHNLQMGSPQVHHPMNSAISIQQPPTHLNSPSQMGQHHHMNSPSPMMGGIPPMVSPPLPMGGTTMPHQPYPNGLPPHVTTTTNTQGLMDITNLTTTGNTLPSMPFTQEIISGFEGFSIDQRPLPSFNNFGTNAGYPLTGQMQPLAVNVGGLSPGENIPPPDRCFNTPMSTQDNSSSPPYENLMSMNNFHGVNTELYARYQEYPPSGEPPPYEFPTSRYQMETNNNQPEEPSKEENNPNIKRRKNARAKSTKNKERQVTSSNPEVPQPNQDGRHKCHDCNKYFNKACYLTQHNKSFHAGDKPFKCSLCGKRFPHQKSHEEHLKKHAGEKPYKCERCPKQFNHKTDLRRHLCLHTGEKPYACDICQKGFIRKDHMVKHVETHKKKQSVGQVTVHQYKG